MFNNVKCAEDGSTELKHVYHYSILKWIKVDGIDCNTVYQLTLSDMSYTTPRYA